MKTEEIAVERLAEDFVSFYSTLDRGSEVVATDAVFDINVPSWRFQLVGPDAFVSWLMEYTSDGYELRIVHLLPTSKGFVVELEGTYNPHGHELYFRNLVACGVQDGKIDDVIYYCTGDWDPETRAHHAHEVKLIRP